MIQNKEERVQAAAWVGVCDPQMMPEETVWMLDGRGRNNVVEKTRIIFYKRCNEGIVKLSV